MIRAIYHYISCYTFYKKLFTTFTHLVEAVRHDVGKERQTGWPTVENRGEGGVSFEREVTSLSSSSISFLKEDGAGVSGLAPSSEVTHEAEK